MNVGYFTLKINKGKIFKGKGKVFKKSLALEPYFMLHCGNPAIVCKC